jgi:hypothetical protein
METYPISLQLNNLKECPMANETLSTRPVGQVAIYACGGGGINISREFDDASIVADVAKIRVTYLDTSDSNLVDGLQEKTFLFEDPDAKPGDEVDGSGKVKAMNAELIEAQVPQALRKFPGLDLCILVYTASGGTGNVIAYNLKKLLLEEGKQVVSIIIGSAENERTAKNTIGTIGSLSDLAIELQRPVIFHWGLNKKGVPRSALDKEAKLMITALCILASRRNHGLDKADLSAFFNYCQPRPDIKPSLARIHLFDDAEKFDADLTDVISAAYLTRTADDVQPGNFVPYSCDGFLPDVATMRGGLFFGIETKSLFGLKKDLGALRDELAKLEQTRTDVPSLGDSTAKKSKSGVYLD